MTDDSAEPRSLTGRRDMLLRLTLEEVPAAVQERWIAHFAIVKGMVEREAATTEAMAEIMGLLQAPKEAPESAAEMAVAHFIAQGFERMAAEDLIDSMGRTAAHILDADMPATMVEHAVANVLDAGRRSGDIEATLTEGIRIRGQIDGWLARNRPDVKARMSSEHWPIMLNILMMEVLRRVETRRSAEQR